ncbi:MAG: tyrosine-protein phosphatase [Lentisphaerae bacterium]|nr:tyrosine-protein phosphatase [Lentisphaerota bacterium]
MSESQASVTLLKPAAGETVSLLNPAHKAYLALPRQERIAFFADPARRGQLAMDAGHWPRPVDFAWHAPAGGAAEYTLHVSRQGDFASGVVVTTRETSFSVYNLRIHCPYFWKVTAVLADGRTIASPVRTFQTADETPRLLRIDGLPNVRDLGGRKTAEGRRVKQDMIFRCTELNAGAYPVYEDEEDVLSRDHGRLRKVKEQLLARIAKARREQAAPPAVVRLPFLLTPAWHVFRPQRQELSSADLDAIRGLTEVPGELLGARREDATVDNLGRFVFANPREGLPSVFMQEFESPADGVMQVGCGGDWFWDFYLNGGLAYYSMSGNGMNPVAASNHVFPVPVKKGRNLAVVVLLSGSAGWVWCCAGQPPLPMETLLARQIAHDELAVAGFAKVLKSRVPAGESRLSAEMKSYMLDTLRIRTDIDLRYELDCHGMSGSPLGASVAWVQVSFHQYDAMVGEEGRKTFAKVFKVLCGEANYPLLFHCAAGRDRTGSLAFILNGLLGVDEEELYKDWEATGFGDNQPFSHETSFLHLIKGLKNAHPQETWRETLEAYVKSCGITREEIDTFRNIMLE